jgi:membrane-bound serine protease (ClpP class)
LGNDRLLSYTAREAVEHGMATALVADLDAVYTRIGVAKTAVVDLSPDSSLKLSWTLAGWAPLLLAAALLCVFLEFKIPAGGLWLGLGALLGVGFFVCQFYLDLASYIEVILLLAGMALIVVELTVLPLHGLMAIIGGILMMIAIVLAFMPNATKFTPDAVGWNDLFTAALKQGVWSIAVVTAGVIAGIAALPRIALKTGLADAAAIDGTSAGADELEAVHLVGQIATTRTLLRPSGQVELRGKTFTAITEHGEHVDLGVAVTVVGARFGELIVSPRT